MQIVKVGNKIYNKGKFFRLKRDKVLSTPLLSGFSNPQSAFVDRQGGRIFVVNTGVDSVTILDYNDPTIVLDDIINSDIGGNSINNPYGIAIDIEGGRIFLVNTTSGFNISILDYTDPTIKIGTIPRTGASVALDPEGGRIFFGGAIGETFVWNWAGTQEIGVITGQNYPRGIIIDEPSNRIFIGQQLSNKVFIYNYETLVKTSEFNVSSPFGLIWDKAYNEIYVASVGGNFVNIYDYQTLTLKRTITQSAGALNSPRFIAIDGYLNRIFIPNSGNHTISVFK